MSVVYPKIRIDFRIGNEKYARRTWFAVPRVGDCVILGAGRDRFPADANGDTGFLVKQIIWGAESKEDRDRDWMTVIVRIEHIPTWLDFPE